MTIPLTCLVAFVLAFQPPAPAVPKADAWKLAQAEDGSYSVEMPAEFKIHKETPKTPRGTFELTVFYCKVDGTLFTAQAIRGVEVPAPGKEQAALEHEQKGFENRGKTKILRQDVVSVGKYTGRDFTTSGPDPQGKGQVTSRTRIFFADKVFFALSAISPIDKPLPANAERFLTSFKPGKAVAPKAPSVDGTPEDAWRTFVTAMVLHDEPALRGVVLPDKDLEVLMRGEVVPKDQVAAVREELRKQPIRRLKAGETIEIPGKGKVTVTQDEATEPKALILPDGAPVPTRCLMVEGHWKIDARAIIASRKAAEAKKP